MLSFIILFLPAFLTVSIFEALAKKDLKPKYWITMYAISVLLVNICCFMFSSSQLNMGSISLHDPVYALTIDIAIIYLLLAIPVSVILGILAAFLKKYLHFMIEAPKDEEK